MLLNILIYPLFLVYDLFTRILAPFIKLHVRNRVIKGKEDPLRYQERFGKTHHKRPKGKLLWIHSASVGESLSALPLIQKIASAHPHLNILVTTGTQTSALLMQQKLPKHAIHQYAPFDVGSWVNTFLKHWQPDLVFWIEAEFWPNMILKAKRRGAELIHLNTRLSDKSLHQWRKIRLLIGLILRQFTLFLPQTQNDKDKLEFLGAKNIKLLGNLKFSSPALPVENSLLTDLKSQIGDRPVWLAASTHMHEEEIVFQTHLHLIKKHPRLLTIIAPRHPRRTPEFVRTFVDRGFEVALRSNKEQIQSNIPFGVQVVDSATRVEQSECIIIHEDCESLQMSKTHKLNSERYTSFYIADTLGELGVFFSLCPVVMVGGSFVSVGGHNIIEPAHFNSAILHGPHMEKNAEMAQLFQEKNAALKVNKEGLARAIETLFDFGDKMEALQKNAYEVAQDQLKILELYYAEISIFLERIVA